MANPTTNFGWVMPTSTDLVTDLPADFAVFGQGVDTSLADLNGGTTGQILSKASNTNLDFTWVSANPGDITGVTAGVGISGGGTSGDVTVTNSMATAIDAKGDLIAGTGADAFSRLGVGTDGQVLTAASAQATGLSWATPASGGMTLLSTTTLSGASTTISSISQSYTHLHVYFYGINQSANEYPVIDPNATNSLCDGIYGVSSGVATSVNGSIFYNSGNAETKGGNTENAGMLVIYNYSNTSGYKPWNVNSGHLDSASVRKATIGSGVIKTTSAISSLRFKNGGAVTYSAGTVLIYGVK